MKDVLIGILVVVLLVLGFLFLKGSKSQESNELFDNDFSSENNNNNGVDQGFGRGSSVSQEKRKNIIIQIQDLILRLI
jgi:uncharacterized protein YxeA